MSTYIIFSGFILCIFAATGIICAFIVKDKKLQGTVIGFTIALVFISAFVIWAQAVELMMQGFK